MSFHHYVRPHHHITTWAVAALLVVLASSSYTNATLAQDQNQTSHGPNDQTKAFFGEGKEEASSGKEQFSPPEACKPKEGQFGSPPPNNSEEQKHFSIIAQYPGGDNGQYNPTSQPSTQYSQPPTQQTPPTQQSSNQPPQGQNPFDNAECKKAMFEAMKNSGGMKRFHDKLDNGKMTEKLDGVTAILDKLSDDQLKAAGATADEVKQINDLKGPIKDAIASLKQAFAEMKAAMDKFFAITDPEEGMNYMRNGGFPKDKAPVMQKTAETLVDNVTKLKTIIDGIANRAPATGSSPAVSSPTGLGGTSGQQ